MEFKKYSSIENSYRTKFLNKLVEEGHSDKTYVVQEKVHGANFSFWTDGKEVRCAKRSGFINEGDKFYNHVPVAERYKEKVKELFKDVVILKFLNTNKVDIESVTVYGELYGGSYPHKDVEKIPNESKVQDKVYYSPRQEFIAFDVKINNYFLPVNAVNEMLKENEIPYAKTLFEGSLEDCLKYSNEFQTTIPSPDLPPIEGNICEGVVIRPTEALFLYSGDRVIIKNKNEKFTEKESKTKAPREVKPLTPDQQKAMDLVASYVNENRLRNVVSKIGEVTEKDFGKIMGLFTQDVIEDFLKDEEEFFETLEKSDRKLVTKKISQMAALILRKNFLNVVDGEF